MPKQRLAGAAAGEVRPRAPAGPSGASRPSEASAAARVAGWGRHSSSGMQDVDAERLLHLDDQLRA